jgi:transcriptional regulator with XRE-family HTH domain
VDVPRDSLLCQPIPHAMYGESASRSGNTVRPLLTPVNRVVTVNTEQGERLRSYIEARWPRSSGGMRGFCREAGVTPETLYTWFRGETSPSFDSLGTIAEKLGVKRFQLVAAMDGEAPVVELDAATRALMRAEVEELLNERLGPRQAPERGTGAA